MLASIQITGSLIEHTQVSSYLLLGLNAHVSNKEKACSRNQKPKLLGPQTRGAAEHKNRTEANRCEKPNPELQLSHKTFTRSLLAVSPEASPGSQWRHSQFKGCETPNNVAFPGSKVVDRDSGFMQLLL